MRCARFLERFGQEPQVARPNHRRYRRTLNCTALYTSSRPSPKSFEIGTAFERDSSASLCWSPGLNCTSKDVVPETSGVANEVPHAAAKFFPGKVVMSASPGRQGPTLQAQNLRRSCADRHNWWTQHPPRS